MRSIRANTAGHRAASIQGFALIELVIAIAVMAIAFGGISVSLASSLSLRKSNQDTARAIRAALSMSDILKDEDFAEVFARYNLDNTDDPAGIGTAPGANFAVAGLTAQENDADGMVGRIRFAGDGLVMREDTVSRNLGMPRDLNGDGAIDALDHAGDYEILPLVISIDWKGAKGDAHIEIAATMTSR